MTNIPTAPDVDELLSKHWPLDGPYSPELLAAATATIAALTRWANHATYHPTGSDALTSAPETYPALGNLAEAARGLGQLTQQLGNWAEGLSRDPTLRDDRESRLPVQADLTARDTAYQLGAAVAAAEELRAALDAAQQHLSHLYHQQPTE